MKLPLNWLKNYIDPKISTEALIERLTMAGLEVEAVEQVAGDTVLEIEVTPNRPDCLNILGLAREIGAITAKVVKYPKITPLTPLSKKEGNVPSFKNIVQIEDKKDCCRYIATLIRDVKIAEAPIEMKKQLASVGINSINNAVDITNFVLMEIGQPLHAFDYDKLAGGKIIVRRAKEGEKITTLDGVERKLNPSILIIADAEKPVAIAGIMGGMGTEITSSTKNILLESAHFEMGNIRRACRSLGLRSDSSYRFERNVHIDGVLTGSNRATDLLLELTGGKLAGRCEFFTKSKTKAPKIRLEISEIENVLGFNVHSEKAKSALLRLGFKVNVKKIASSGSRPPRNDTSLIVVPPPFRADIKEDVDVIEEIARMIGFDHLPTSMPLIKAVNIVVDKRPREIKDKIRRVLTAHGADEIVTLSMISAKALAKTNITDIPKVKVFNPLSLDQEWMRPSMLPSMLQAASTNINRGQKNLSLFEIGKRYFADSEKETVAILITGKRYQDWRLSKKDTVEIFDLKGMVQDILHEIGISETVILSEAKDLKVSKDSSPQGLRMTDVYDLTCCATMMINGKYLGSFGRVDQGILNNWDIKNQDIYFAGIHLDEIYPLPSKTIKYQAISEFPAIARDVSLAVKKEISYQRIVDICKVQGGDILKQVQFIEQYLGDKLQAGEKALVFSLQYQSNEKTLREEEITHVHERIVQALIRELAATRR